MGGAETSGRWPSDRAYTVIVAARHGEAVLAAD
jgi:hypothetical protein